MRPGQQNRRMRGRGGGGGNNPNRKGPNPLTRNYESNGPDVKIRGSAQQIAEKYSNLARDAQSAGDRVMAENYLQHAEHYNRIIAAAQAQMPVQQMRDNRDEMDEGAGDERDDFEPAAAAPAKPEATRAPITGAEPQPEIEGMPAEVALEQETLDRERKQERERRANGDGSEDGSEQEARPRRARRPRRSRAEQEAADDAQPAAEASDAAAEEPRGAKEPEIIVPVSVES